MRVAEGSMRPRGGRRLIKISHGQSVVESGKRQAMLDYYLLDAPVPSNSFQSAAARPRLRWRLQHFSRRRAAPVPLPPQ